MTETQQQLEARMMRATKEILNNIDDFPMVMSNRDIWVLTAVCNLAASSAPTGQQVIDHMIETRDLLVDSLCLINPQIRGVVSRQAEGEVKPQDNQIMGQTLSQVVYLQIDSKVNDAYWLISCMHMALRDSRVNSDQAFHMIQIGRQIQEKLKDHVSQDVIDLLNMGWDEFFDMDSTTRQPINDWGLPKNDHLN